MASIILKQAPLITLLLRFGETSLMISRVMFGLWAAFCMKWLLWKRLSKLKIWTICLRRWLKDPTRRSQRYSLLTFITWSELCWPWTQLWDHLYIKYFQCLAFWQGWKRCSRRIPRRINQFNRKTQLRNLKYPQGWVSLKAMALSLAGSYYPLLETPRTLKCLKISCQNPTLSLKWFKTQPRKRIRRLRICHK